MPGGWRQPAHHGGGGRKKKKERGIIWKMDEWFLVEKIDASHPTSGGGATYSPTGGDGSVGDRQLGVEP
jgi:hypothetical protein